jgi:hypothetical protein
MQSSRSGIEGALQCLEKRRVLGILGCAKVKILAEMITMTVDSE